MVENEEIYQKKNEEQGYDKDFDGDFGNFQEELKQMKNPSVYADDTSDSHSSSTGHAISQPNDHLKFQVRDGVEGKEVKVYGDGQCMF